MNETVMWVSNLLSFFAIVVAAGALIWQTNKLHKNNVKLAATAKLQRELDAVKKLHELIVIYQWITSQVITKIDDCLAKTYHPDSIPVILQSCSNHYASLRILANTIFGELRAEEARMFCDFLTQAFAAENMLAARENDDGMDQSSAKELNARKEMLNEFNGKFAELKCLAYKVVAGWPSNSSHNKTNR